MIGLSTLPAAKLGKAGAFVMLLAAVFALGTCASNRFAQRGIAKTEVQTAERRAENVVSAAESVVEHQAKQQQAVTFFEQADAAITTHYAARLAPTPLPISEVTRETPPIACACPVVLFDDDELRLFNLGNKAVEVYGPRYP